MQALAQQYRVIAEAGHISNLENSGFATSCVAGVPGCESLVKPVEIPAMEYATAGDVRVQPGGGSGWGQPRVCGEPDSSESILCTLARYKLFDANRVICTTVG